MPTFPARFARTTLAVLVAAGGWVVAMAGTSRSEAASLPEVTPAPSSSRFT